MKLQCIWSCIIHLIVLWKWLCFFSWSLFKSKLGDTSNGVIYNVLKTKVWLHGPLSLINQLKELHIWSVASIFAQKESNKYFVDCFFFFLLTLFPLTLWFYLEFVDSSFDSCLSAKIWERMVLELGELSPKFSCRKRWQKMDKTFVIKQHSWVALSCDSVIKIQHQYVSAVLL